MTEFETGLFAAVVIQGVAIVVLLLLDIRYVKDWFGSRWRRFRYDPRKFRRTMDELHELFRKDLDDMVARLRDCPDNGRTGYWSVTGMRHNAIVKASSALEAVERAKEIVQDWELVSAEFLGENMPDIYPF